MAKRLFDVAVGSFLLIFAIPAIVICGIAIKMDSRGPVFFLQPRVGRGFRRFRLIKLRTMKDAARGDYYSVGNDLRVTRLGRFLRRYKLDELPQLWNVMRGEMSLVGPRPVVPEVVEAHREAYEGLLCARPGLTDPATLKYSREAEMLARQADPDACFRREFTPDKLRISQRYLERATLGSDAMVLLATIARVAEPLWRHEVEIGADSADQADADVGMCSAEVGVEIFQETRESALP